MLKTDALAVVYAVIGGMGSCRCSPTSVDGEVSTLESFPFLVCHTTMSDIDWYDPIAMLPS
jgi:hypothetical protein